MVSESLSRQITGQTITRGHQDMGPDLYPFPVKKNVLFIDCTIDVDSHTCSLLYSSPAFFYSWSLKIFAPILIVCHWINFSVFFPIPTELPKFYLAFFNQIFQLPVKTTAIWTWCWHGMFYSSIKYSITSTTCKCSNSIMTKVNIFSEWYSLYRLAIMY